MRSGHLVSTVDSAADQAASVTGYRPLASGKGQGAVKTVNVLTDPILGFVTGLV